MPPTSPFPTLLRCLRIPSVAAAAKRTTTATPAFTPSFFLGRGKTTIQKRFQHNPADHDPTWVSVLDKPATLVRHNRKHRPLGLAFLILMPITAFALGSWQIYRLEWKTDLIARYEDRLVRPPLPLPPKIDLDALEDFDYRRVIAVGRYRHSGEMLLGPRIYEGENGFQVITPLDRPNGASTILVNRGWIAKDMMRQEDRSPEALPSGEVEVHGLLRGHHVWKKNMFTPDNRPDKGEFYFPDIKEMAALVGAQPVWVEETTVPDYVTAHTYMKKGIPIGRPAVVDLRNNHLQYIVTWYALSVCTSIMFYILVKKPSPDISRRVRTNMQW
ncbi:SURF1 family protein [Peziza echinospora]|nr:SURF1 family protein [Peziza echinospora]